MARLTSAARLPACLNRAPESLVHLVVEGYAVIGEAERNLDAYFPECDRSESMEEARTPSVRRARECNGDSRQPPNPTVVHSAALSIASLTDGNRCEPDGMA